MSLKAPGLVSSRPKVITKLQKAAVASTLEQSRIDYDLDNLVTNQAMNTQFRELELRLDAKISDIKYDMVKWIAGMMLAQAGVIAALVKLL